MLNSPILETHFHYAMKVFNSDYCLRHWSLEKNEVDFFNHLFEYNTWADIFALLV